MNEVEFVWCLELWHATCVRRVSDSTTRCPALRAGAQELFGNLRPLRMLASPASGTPLALPTTTTNRDVGLGCAGGWLGGILLRLERGGNRLLQLRGPHVGFLQLGANLPQVGAQLPDHFQPLSPSQPLQIRQRLHGLIIPHNAGVLFATGRPYAIAVSRPATARR